MKTFIMRLLRIWRTKASQYALRCPVSRIALHYGSYFDGTAGFNRVQGNFHNGLSRSDLELEEYALSASISDTRRAVLKLTEKVFEVRKQAGKC